MTVNEAIGRIRYLPIFRYESNREEHSYLFSALEMAVNALEKQEPQKPVEKFTGNEWVCECPTCGGQTDTPNEVMIESIQYCGCCGQRLDWEGIAENKNG